jgi:hypothetical protein
MILACDGFGIALNVSHEQSASYEFCNQKYLESVMNVTQCVRMKNELIARSDSIFNVLLWTANTF